MSEMAWFRQLRGSRWLSLVLILVRTLLRPPVQLFQPYSQCIPGGWASHTVLALWAVNSQEGQYVADPRSQVLKGE
jgi:hypothetical protein